MADLFGANSILRTGSSPAQIVSGKDAAGIAEAPVRARETMANEVSGLKAGDTFKAQVVERNDNQVTLRLPDDSVIHASIGKGIPAAVGETLTFEVRSNQSTLSLSPLYTNTASDPTALRALDMAGIPASDKAVSMTTSMMQAGMSIDRNSLLQMFSSVNNHPSAPVQDVVDLTRLGIPVNDQNLAQISDYKNLSYELGVGMREVADSMNQTILGLVQNGDTVKAGEVLLSLAEIAESSLPEDLEAAIASLRETAGEAEDAGEESNPAVLSKGTEPAQTGEVSGSEGKASAQNTNVAENVASNVTSSPVSQNEEGQAPLSAAQKALELLKAMQSGEDSGDKAGSLNGNSPSAVDAKDGSVILKDSPDGAASPLKDSALTENKAVIRDPGLTNVNGDSN
jgi:hypothetical protein